MVNTHDAFVGRIAEWIQTASNEHRCMNLHEFAVAINAESSESGTGFYFDTDSLLQMVHLGFRMAVQQNCDNIQSMERLVASAFRLDDECAAACLVFEEWADCVSASSLPSIFRCLLHNAEKFTANISSTKGHGLSILRLCNELLRRLSKTKYSEFCGHIVLFMCRLFPPAERSALNLRGEYNTDNVTPIDDCQPVDELSASYSEFWRLQSHMHQSVTTISVADVRRVLTNVNWLLSKWESIPPASSKRQAQHPKFLSNHTLFGMQFVDGDFRATICFELGIFFDQLLQYKASFLPDIPELETHATSLLSRIFGVVKCSVSGLFTEIFLKELLQSEHTWIAWKLQSCPSFDLDPFDSWNNICNRSDHPLDNSPLNTNEVKSVSIIDRLISGHKNQLHVTSYDTNAEIRSILAPLAKQVEPSSGVDEEYRFSKNVEFRWSVIRALLNAPIEIDAMFLAQCNDGPVLDAFASSDKLDMQL